MALDKKKINMPIIGGLDTKTDEKSLAPIDFLELENVSFNTPKAFVKRTGFDALSLNTVTSTLPTQIGIGAVKEELAVSTKEGLYTYSPEQSKWYYKGDFTTIDEARDGLAGYGSLLQKSYVYAQNDDYTVVAYETNTSNETFYLDIFDRTSLTLIKRYEYDHTATVQLYKAEFIGNTVFIFSGPLASNVDVFFVDVSLYATSITVTSFSADSFDTVVIGSSIFVGSTHDSANVIRARSISSLGVISSAFTVHSTAVASTATISVHLCGTQDLRLFYGDVTNGFYTARVNNALDTVQQSPVSVFSGYAGTNTVTLTSYRDSTVNTDAVLLLRNTTTTYGNAIYVGKLTGGSFAVQSTNSGIIAENVDIKSNMVYSDGAYYFLSASENYYNPTSSRNTTINLHKLYYRDSVYDSSIVACVEREQADNVGAFNTHEHVGHMDIVLNGSAISYVAKVMETPTVGTMPARLVRYSHTPNIMSHISPVTFGNSLYFNTPVPYLYDGVVATEVGFLNRSELTVTVNSGTGSLAAGNWQAAAVYEWVDANGDLHISAPEFYSFTTALNDSITFKVKYLNNSSKKNAIIKIYMTEVNGSVLYKYITFDNVDRQLELSYGPVSPAISTAREILYTLTGEIENQPPKAMVHACKHKTRLFYISSNRDTLYYSKTKTDGYALEFNNQLQVPLDPAGGRAYAVAAIDDYICIFKESGIHVLSGDGPNNSGQGTDFRVPSVLQVEVGTVEPQSVVSTPVGIFFKSAKGIYVLERGLTVKYIGDKVCDYDSETVVSSVLMATINEIRLITSNANCLVYDYYVGKWTVYKNYDFTASVVYNNALLVLRDGGGVWGSTSGYDDEGTAIDTKMVSSWVQLADIQGFQRLYSIMLLGKYVGRHYLKVSIAYNFDDTYVDEYSYAITADPTNYQFEFYPKIQKCTAFKIKIETLVHTTPTAGAILSNIALRVGVKQGLQKLPTANKFAMS